LVFAYLVCIIKMHKAKQDIDINVVLLVCNAMWTSELKMETVCSSETLVSTYKPTWL
jgi:hypothetical protein